MEYTCRGRSGLMVSRLAFGPMTFGDRVPGISGLTDESVTDRLVPKVLDAGLNLFDTAA